MNETESIRVFIRLDIELLLLMMCRDVSSLTED